MAHSVVSGKPIVGSMWRFALERGPDSGAAWHHGDPRNGLSLTVCLLIPII